MLPLIIIGIMEGVIADEELKKLKFVFVDFTGPGHDDYGKEKTVDIATLKIPVENGLNTPKRNGLMSLRCYYLFYRSVNG
jgi:hypothetical protein